MLSGCLKPSFMWQGCLNINDVPQERVNKEMPLKAVLVGKQKRYCHKEKSSQEKDGCVSNSCPLCIVFEAKVETTNRVLITWLPKVLKV